MGTSASGSNSINPENRQECHLLLVHGYIQQTAKCLSNIISTDIIAVISIFYHNPESKLLFCIMANRRPAESYFINIDDECLNCHQFRIYTFQNKCYNSRVCQNTSSFTSAQNVLLPKAINQSIHKIGNTSYDMYSANLYSSYRMIFRHNEDYHNSNCVAFLFNEIEFFKPKQEPIIGFKWDLPNLSETDSQLLYSDKYGLLGIGPGSYAMHATSKIWNLSFSSSAYFAQNSYHNKWKWECILKSRKSSERDLLGFNVTMIDDDIIMIVGAYHMELMNLENKKRMYCPDGIKRYRFGITCDDNKDRAFIAGGVRSDVDWRDDVDVNTIFYYDMHKQCWFKYGTSKVLDNDQWPKLWMTQSNILNVFGANGKLECWDTRTDSDSKSCVIDSDVSMFRFWRVV